MSAPLDSQQGPEPFQKAHSSSLDFRFTMLSATVSQSYLVMPVHIWNLWIYTGIAVHCFSSNFKINLTHHIKIPFSSDFIWPLRRKWATTTTTSSAHHTTIITLSHSPAWMNAPKPDLNQNRPIPCEVLVSLFPWYSEILLSKLLSCSRYCSSDFTLLKTIYISTSTKMKCNEG